MRILYLTLLDFPRRVANRGQIFNMCEGFSQHADCTLVIAHSYLKEDELRAYYGVGNGFRIRTLGSWVRRSRVLTLVRLFALILSSRPDLIYVREEKLAHLLSFTPFKYVYEIHELFPARTALQLRAIEKSFMTVAIMASLVEEAVRLGASGDRFIVENLATSASFYNGGSTFHAPEGMEPDDGKVHVLYSGRFSIQKGVYCLVEAMTHLPENFELLLLGGFEGEAELMQTHAEKNRVGDRVRVLGHKPHSEVHHYLKAADILVLPNSKDATSFRHTNPLKLYEYLAAGRPVVASRIDAISSVVSEDMVSFFAPDDPEDLARAICETIQNKAAAEERVAKGRDYVSARTWDARAGRILETFKRRSGTLKRRHQEA